VEKCTSSELVRLTRSARIMSAKLESVALMGLLANSFVRLLIISKPNMAGVPACWMAATRMILEWHAKEIGFYSTFMNCKLLHVSSKPVSKVNFRFLQQFSWWTCSGLRSCVTGKLVSDIFRQLLYLETTKRNYPMTLRRTPQQLITRLEF
jgi:hypothetical protein